MKTDQGSLVYASIIKVVRSAFEYNAADLKSRRKCLLAYLLVHFRSLYCKQYGP